MKAPPMTTDTALTYWYVFPILAIAWIIYRRGREAWEMAKPMMFSLAAIMIWAIWSIFVTGVLGGWIFWNVKVLGNSVMIGN